MAETAQQVQADVDTTGAPQAREGFEQLTQDQQVQRFLRCLRFEHHDLFAIALKSTDPGTGQDIWRHREAEVKCQQNGFQFRKGFRVGDLKKALDEGKSWGSGSWESHTKLRGVIDPKWQSHVYVRTSEFRGLEGGVNAEDVTKVRCWWMESDGPAGTRIEQVKTLEALERLGLKFNAVVDSGGKSIHTFIRKPPGVESDWQTDKRIMQKLAVLLKGDLQVIQPNRLMRMPGFDRPGGQPQRLLWGTEEVLYPSAEELEDLLWRIGAEWGVENWEGEIAALGRSEAKEQGWAAAQGSGELAEQWKEWEEKVGWTDEDRRKAAALLFPVDLREFVPREVNELLANGSQNGHRNQDGIKITLALAGAENALADLGLRFEKSVEELLEGYADASENAGDAFDRERLQLQLDGVRDGGAMPSRPVEGFLNSLHFNTHGVLGEKKSGQLAQPSEAGLAGLIGAVGPFISPEDDQEAPPPRLYAGNIKTLLEEKVGDHLKLNDLTRQLEFCGEMLRPEETELSYVDMQQQGRICEQKPWLDALVRVGQQHRFDPVRNYLLNLEQAQEIDPVDLNSLATEYLGTESELSNQMLRVALLGAVWRRMNPGCQFDSVVVLKGAQGIRKSTFWRVLASPDWFCDTTPKDNKDLVLNVHSCWMFELAELESVTGKRGVGELKALITTPSDQVRMPYGKASEKKDRASIFVSSVNGDDFLNDHTGSRRFLVIECPQNPERGEFIDIDKLLADRDRIWRAAVLAWRNGEKPTLSWELQAQSQQQNAEFATEDPWGSRLDRWLEGEGIHEYMTQLDGQPDPNKPFTTTDALLASGVCDQKNLERKHEMRMSVLLKARGFEKQRQRIEGSRAWYWIRTQESEVAQPAVPTAAIDVGTATDEVGTESDRCKQVSQPQAGQGEIGEVGTGLGQEVGTAQTPGPGCDLEQLSQPSQPFSSKGIEVINKGEERLGVTAEGRRSKGSEKGWDGWDGWDTTALTTEPDSGESAAAAAVQDYIEWDPDCWEL